MKGLTKSRVVIIVGFVLIAAYIIWNYRYEYSQTYSYKELSPADASAYVPADKQPKAVGMELYTLAKQGNSGKPYRYVFWSRQNEKEQGYQTAQLKLDSEGFTINVKPIAATKEDEVKADYIVLIESKNELKPFLLYEDNKKTSAQEVSLQ